MRSKGRKQYPYRMKLKPLDEVLEGHNFIVRTAETIYVKSQGWTINRTMQQKFGDGFSYRYMKVNHRNYDYLGMDDFYYHRDWFEVVGSPIIELDDKDFML